MVASIHPEASSGHSDTVMIVTLVASIHPEASSGHSDTGMIFALIASVLILLRSAFWNSLGHRGGRFKLLRLLRCSAIMG